MTTYLEAARNNVVMDDFVTISNQEQVCIETVMQEVAAGRAVIIPNRGGGSPIIYGAEFRSKVLCNIGTSSKSPGMQGEIEKARIALDKGASIICDQSVGDDVGLKRRQLVEAIKVPIASVPFYQNVEEARARSGDPLGFNPDEIIEVFERQIAEGVSAPGIPAMNRYMKEVVDTSGRLMPVVSRGAGILLQWMRNNDTENPYFEYYEEVLAIARKYNVPITFVSGVRSGTVVDGFDECQRLEWQMLADYINKAHSAGVPVIVDGLGHMTIDQIPVAVEYFKKHCYEIPMGALGPASSDRGLGQEHIVNAIGTAVAVWSGVNYVNACYRTEHLGLPETQDIPEGIATAVMACYTGDLAREKTKARLMTAEREMSTARKNNQWGLQLKYAIDKEQAIATYKRVGAENKTGEGCNICGDLCPFVVTEQVERKV
jgi:phosphomethylpyrimidine synthase